MVKINLKIVEIEDVELKRQNTVPYTFTRIFTFAGYKKKDGNFFIRRAIRGIIKKHSCTIPVKIGFVESKLIDELKNETPIFTSLVYCADSNEVPLIFGMKEALDKFKMEIDIAHKEGYLIYL